MQGKNLRLQLGYSHDVNIAVPEELTGCDAGSDTVVISGQDKQRVGQLAAEIRSGASRALQGQGHQYRGEYIFRKEGKKK
jgi:large subunit ribosomal protein L6